MILYVNGCSHTAAAEAVVEYAFAEDDPVHYRLGRQPHPKNLAASWCTHLAQDLDYDLVCDAESAASNFRIIRTTKAWLEANPELHPDVFVIIQWSGWEREEWLHDGTWYQVNASGVDVVPKELQDRYRQFVIDVDWNRCTQQWHERIWQFHLWLESLEIRHLFYNAHSTFSNISDRHNWGLHYLSPYDITQSYDGILKNNGFGYVNPKSYHFDAKAHCFWAKYLLQYIVDNKI